MEDFSSFALSKRVPSSVSAADAATNCRRDVKMGIVPFKLMGYLSWGSYTKKKYPLAWPFVLVEPRYHTLK